MAYLRKNIGTVTGIVTQEELDAADNRLKTNLALLSFRQAVDHNDAKYNLQDQIVDEYYSAAGIDGTPSTNHTLTSGVYSSGSTATISHNATASATHLTYTYWKWTTVTSTGTFTTDTTANYDYIVVGGGGGGGQASGGGGGGAGGFRTASGFSVSGTISSITVGVGGPGSTGGTDHGDNGASSVFSTITSTGGGGGGSENTSYDHGLAGASGGGGARRSAGTGGASNTPYGNDGGDAFDAPGGYWGGGGGGSGAVGAAATSTQGGAGGVGENEVMGMNAADSDTFLTAISQGEDEADGLRYFSGGGGGGSGASGSGGAGGYGGGTAGGRQSSSAVVDVANNTGGGGGGAYDAVATTTRGANGGSGIVIIRTLTSGLSVAADIILQSTDTEAETTPTKADMVLMVEDAGTGVGVVNTNIKGFISRDSGTTFTEGVLVAAAMTGVDDQRILTFHDLDISAQPDDKTMCYKITTHGQSAVYNTKIHATSIGWR